MKNLQLGITEFAVPSPRSGSIETYSGFGALPNVGSEIHGWIQQQRAVTDPGYQAEKWVTHSFAVDGYKIAVSGRVDGVFPSFPTRIEEIKTAYNPTELVKALDKSIHHPYRMQLRTYGYIHYKNTGEIPSLVLHVVSSRTRAGFDYPVELDVEDYENWLTRRLQEIRFEAKMFEALKKRRKKVASRFTFPFNEPRQGQIELMATVKKHLNSKTSLLLQAPTGLGKTAGVLFPTLNEALARGEKVIYLTPKNSQHAVAEDAIQRLQKAGTKARGLTIHAKAKMCFKEQVVCNPEYCEYARDYYGKVAENKLVDKLAKKKSLTFRSFEKFGRQYEVCPFELQLDSVHRADVIVCDYNYVFSPRNSLARLSYNGFDKKTAPNLVIDEAHNLPTRAADYFSAGLSSAEMRELQMGFHHLPLDLRARADSLVGDSLSLISQNAAGSRPQKVVLELKTFLEHAARVQEFLAKYLESPSELQPKDSVLAFCNLWSNFVGALENLNEDFFSSFTPTPQGGSLKITCCDASSWLNESYDQFANVVAFSATVKPFEYYSKLLGFSKRTSVSAEFTSPFPRERRKLLIIPQVSTKFNDRESNYYKIKEGIERIVEIKPGNYFVFFPSFDFLNRVASLLSLPDFQVLTQKREMKRGDVQSFIEALHRPDQPTLIMAVQGGVFAEGVDYPGEMLIGAIIVGPALPSFDFDREMLRDYFAKKHGAENGFDYAYTYPAMAKVVQSAGRVIRSHNDRGLIVLMDRRFIHNNYVKSMPADWVGDDPQAHVSQQLLADIRRFWDENEAQPSHD